MGLTVIGGIVAVICCDGRRTRDRLGDESGMRVRRRDLKMKWQ